MRQPQHVTMCVPCWMTRWLHDVVVCVCAWTCEQRLCACGSRFASFRGTGWTFLLSSVSEPRAQGTDHSVFACVDVGPSSESIFNVITVVGTVGVLAPASRDRTTLTHSEPLNSNIQLTLSQTYTPQFTKGLRSRLFEKHAADARVGRNPGSLCCKRCRPRAQVNEQRYVSQVP